MEGMRGEEEEEEEEEDDDDEGYHFGETKTMEGVRNLANYSKLYVQIPNV